MKKKILIITPSFNLVGGVANHYMGLGEHWNNDVRYQFYGKRHRIPAIITFGYDLLSYIFKLIFNRPQLVIINPSLRTYQLIRDGIYLAIARALKVEVITFFHGWDIDYAHKLKNNPRLFTYFYNKSLFVYVLASEFKKQLLEIGINCEIKLTTTKVSNKLLAEFDINKRDGKINSILFLGRIVKNKGIFIMLDAFKIIQKKHNEIELVVVGNGYDFDKAKRYVLDQKIDNVSFKGGLFGNEIIPQFSNSQLYVLPSYHGEGMPTSVLEAMAFGMPVITRPLGGLNDFFESEVMGTLTESLDPKVYAFEIEKYLNNIEMTLKIAQFNHQYANENFMANRVAQKIETDINDIFKNK
jgi:glycosyltransferase involved in cell wall biosynthesis